MNIKLPISFFETSPIFESSDLLKLFTWCLFEVTDTGFITIDKQRAINNLNTTPEKFKTNIKQLVIYGEIETKEIENIIKIKVLNFRKLTIKEI